MSNTTRVYCDTNVYVDLFKDRKQGFQDFAEFALQFFQRVRDGEYILVISDWVYNEIKKPKVMGSDKELQELINSFETHQRIYIEKTHTDIQEAKQLSYNNFDDALHVILAKKANAIYLVTRNIKHFEEFRDIVEITLPERL